MASRMKPNFDQQRDLGQDSVPAALSRGGGGLGQAAGPDPGQPHPHGQEV